MCRRHKNQLKITDSQGQWLILDAADFVILCQRRLLQKCLDQAAGDVDPLIPIPDFAQVNSLAAKTARWKCPPFGELWDQAHKVCSQPDIAEKWKRIVRNSATIQNPRKRRERIQRRLNQAEITLVLERPRPLDSWEKLMLMLAHCGATQAVGEWLLTKEDESSPEFERFKDLLVPTGYEPPDYSRSTGPILGR
jgi:hypothetical protein